MRTLIATTVALALSAVLSAQGRWQNMNPGLTPPTIRSNYAMAYDTKHKVVVLYGGQNSNGTIRTGTSSTGWKQQTWFYDVPTNTWTGKDQVAAGGPDARQEAVMVYDNQADRILMYGGWSSNAGNAGNFNDLYEMNLNIPIGQPNFKTWVPVTVTGTKPPADASVQVRGAFGPDLMVIYLVRTVGTGAVSETWSFDYRTKKWTQNTGTQPSVAYNSSMLYDPLTKSIIRTGGRNANSNYYTLVNQTYTCTLGKRTFSAGWGAAINSSPNSQSGSACFFGSSSVNMPFTFGGEGVYNATIPNNLDSVHFYSASAWALQPTANPNMGVRQEISSVYIPSLNGVLTFGGRIRSGIPSNDTYHNDTNLYRAGAPAQVIVSGVTPPCGTLIDITVDMHDPIIGTTYTNTFLSNALSKYVYIFRGTTLRQPPWTFNMGCQLFVTSWHSSTKTDVNGTGSYTVSIPNILALAGTVYYTQALHWDGGMWSTSQVLEETLGF